MEKIGQSKKSNKRIFEGIILAIKLVIAITLVFLAFSTSKNLHILLVSLCELFTIILVTQLATYANKIFGNILFGLLLLLFCFQQIVLYVSNSFLNRNMLANVGSFEALGSKGQLYLIFVIAVAVFCFIPTGVIKINSLLVKIFVSLLILATYSFSLFVFGVNSSPFGSFGQLLIKEHKIRKQINEIQYVEVEKYDNYIGDSRPMDQNLPNNPNIILIFVEGMSDFIIDDSRDITPNLSRFRSESLSFENYYNHTFATYNGIRGQLYSGFSNSNLAENHLLSLQSILSAYGYHTCFINTEYVNDDFVTYIDRMHFDDVVTYENSDYWNDYYYLHDEISYQLLFDTATELHNADSPFLLTMYSFGTHMELDSTDVVYGDGSNEVLNRFYNLDNAFGEFFDAFENSELAEDTIIILTADHATYFDRSAIDAGFDHFDGVNYFPVNRLPFIIYYDGITPEEIDVNGRNSLSLAPTILDFIDIETHTNFLGNSLFDVPTQSGIDTFYYDGGFAFSTSDGNVVMYGEAPEDLLELIYGYYSIME